jgi:hypothetical protein
MDGFHKKLFFMNPMLKKIIDFKDICLLIIFTSISRWYLFIKKHCVLNEAINIAIIVNDELFFI